MTTQLRAHSLMAGLYAARGRGDLVEMAVVRMMSAAALVTERRRSC